MKIAFIDIYNPIPINSGGDWYRYQLLRELSKNHEVVEYYTFNKSKRGYYPSDIAFKIEHIKSRLNWMVISDKLEMIRPDLLLGRNLLKEITADVVFCIAELYHIGKYISRKNKAPFVLIMHNVEWQYLKNMGSFYWFPLMFYENYVLKKSDAIISLSPEDIEYASRYTNKEKIFYIPPLPDPRVFNPYDSAYDYGSDRFNILFYGSLDREHNIEALNFIKRKLIPELKKEGFMERIRINIFGSGKPPEEMNIENDKDINFLGCVDDPGKYIRGADVVIVPVFNSSGVKIRILEALSCGKTVIATSEAIKGLPSNLNDKIIVCNTSQEFVKKISSLVNMETHLDGGNNTDMTSKYTLERLFDFLYYSRKIYGERGG